MDLHVERLPDGRLRDREALPEADLAARHPMAAAAGVVWNRWSLYWDMVERDGQFDWLAADGIVARDVGTGLRTLAILQGTPSRYATGGLLSVAVPHVGGGGLEEWSASAADGGVAVQSTPPRDLDVPIFRRADGSLTDDPAPAADVNQSNPWARFVAAAVRRYRPGGALAIARGWPVDAGIRAWEVGNEPNLGHFWSGTPESFVRYLEVAYLVIKWLDPEAVVLHGGIADGENADTWYGQFLDALVARAAASPLPGRYGYYFDAAAWHWYTYPSLLQTGPARARALVAARGLPAKPIWVTEMGVPIWSEHPGPCWDATSPWRATVAEQAGYVWQASAEGLAAGVAVMLHFQLYDDCGNGPTSYDAFGLVRNSAANQCWQPPAGQPCWRFDPANAGLARPALSALEVAARELAEVSLLWRPPREAGFWQRVLFFRPPDTRVTVVWNWLRADQDVELYGTGAAATVLRLDETGAVESEAVVPEGGRFAVKLPGTTNRNNPGNQAPVMAGRPVIVIERDSVRPFRAEVAPLPPESPRRFDLTVAAADGGTGVAAYRVWLATSPPSRPEDWQPLTGERAWTAPALAGTVLEPFEGESGRDYYFAAQARDRAGNWSALPTVPQASTRITEPGSGPTVTPGPSATPSAGPTPAATPTPTATATSTVTPTASGPTPTPGPLTERVMLPLVGSRLEPPVDATAVATPGCQRFTVAVRGPRGGVITGEDVRWWLRSFGAGDDVGRTFVGAAGQSVCIDPPPRRAVAWAEAPGFVTNPPQDLALGDVLYLSAVPNLLANGSFEAGLAGWLLSGSAPPEPLSAGALSGAGQAVLGADFVGQPDLGGGGNSTLSQVVSLPDGSSTLSFEYRFDSRATCDGGGCRYLDRLEVIVVALEDPALRATYLTGDAGVSAPVERWSHLWYDLSPWAGERVQVILNLFQPDASEPSRVWLDNVAVGGAPPRGGLAAVGTWPGRVRDQAIGFSADFGSAPD